MRGFILGIAAAGLVWAAGWDNVALVLDTADAAARKALAGAERHLADARARRAPKTREDQ